MTLTLYLPDEAHTQALAQRLAAVLLPALTQADAASAFPPVGARLHLKGELGSGKTTFARALLRAFGVTGRIKSPSYALLESYKISNLYLHHLDFYRFGKEQDWEDAGFRDVLQAQALILVEWPEQAGALLPAPDLELSLRYVQAQLKADNAAVGGATPSTGVDINPATLTDIHTGRQAQLAARSTQGHAWLTTLTHTLRTCPDPGGGVCLPLPSAPPPC